MLVSVSKLYTEFWKPCISLNPKMNATSALIKGVENNLFYMNIIWKPRAQYIIREI